MQFTKIIQTADFTILLTFPENWDGSPLQIEARHKRTKRKQLLQVGKDAIISILSIEHSPKFSANYNEFLKQR